MLSYHRLLYDRIDCLYRNKGPWTEMAPVDRNCLECLDRGSKKDEKAIVGNEGSHKEPNKWHQTR